MTLQCVILSINDKTYMISENGDVLRLFVDRDLASKYGDDRYNKQCYLIDIVHQGLHYYVIASAEDMSWIDDVKIKWLYDVDTI